ncbi:PREDICTED: uncharacterized protein LOC109128872 [Camelina sativa]|uniref:Uncharacterized protein LOC109128872 n=1 Tax=Camelina sativa TaxID=90675 RepID=A0ABM1QXS0_CAMSA|nr:PREDICTED: uncharacterized protein LOC109128872 [Camelina sativa]
MKQTMTETPYVTLPPPMVYMVITKDDDSPQTVHQTESKGSDGFVRGW